LNRLGSSELSSYARYFTLLTITYRSCTQHIAASEGHLSICKWLVLEQEARINRSDRWGGSPLDDAKRHRHAKVFAFLRQQGAVFGSPSQANNLITAASEGDVDEVRDLLEYGNIDVNEGDYDQRTALHLAASATGEGQLQVIELLCQAGANVNAEDRWGNRPLDDAKRSGGAKTNVKCIQLLERHGATCGLSSSLSAKKASLGEDVLHDLMSKYGKVRDGELSMDWHDVKDLLVGIGEDPSAVTDDVVQKLFEVADVDKDGLISTRQFIANSDVFLGGRPARIILVVGGPGSGKVCAIPYLGLFSLS
jgi:Ankyrin repeats (3 copies)